MATLYYINHHWKRQSAPPCGLAWLRKELVLLHYRFIVQDLLYIICETSVQAIIYDYADEKNVMVVARVTPHDTRHSTWTLAWAWSKVSGFAPWEYFVKNTTKTHQPSHTHNKIKHWLGQKEILPWKSPKKTVAVFDRMNGNRKTKLSVFDMTIFCHVMTYARRGVIRETLSGITKRGRPQITRLNYVTDWTNMNTERARQKNWT